MISASDEMPLKAPPTRGAFLFAGSLLLDLFCLHAGVPTPAGRRYRASLQPGSAVPIIVDMDDIVRQAIAKWPNVPHCFGWLGLDARGNWYMRDDRTQAAGPFPQSKGSLLKHEKLIEFIHRNYERDAAGQWFFQNGPQRVYVELEITPWIWRLGPEYGITSHSGRSAQVLGAFVDEAGRLYLDTELGFGLVHTLDVQQAAEAVEQGLWSPQEVRALELPQRFGFVPSPAAHRQPA
jgi:hypothetical protein